VGVGIGVLVGFGVAVGVLVAVGATVTAQVGPKVIRGVGVPGPTVATHVGPKVGKGVAVRVAVCANTGFTLNTNIDNNIVKNNNLFLIIYYCVRN
jgi:hypothetical protein